MSPGSKKLSTSLPPCELLKYLADYGILLCTSCEYAIQPDAVTRHLKEIHGILRGSRKPYLAHASSFQLAEPQVVLKRSVAEFPVSSLPIIDGFLCEYANCDHLCASQKRMQSHWLTQHGHHSESTKEWCQVPMQTFFRGNLLCYFTDPVLYSCHYGGSSLERRLKAAEILALVYYNRHHMNNHLDGCDELLLRHYIRETSLTLAAGQKDVLLWQVTITELAGRAAYLMHGILACSALHRLHLRCDQQSEMIMKASYHFDIAVPLYRHAISNTTSETSSAILAFAHLLVINSFAMQDQDEPLLLINSDAIERMPAWLFFIRNGCSMLCELREQLLDSSVNGLVRHWEEPVGHVTANVEASWKNHFAAIILAPSKESSWSNYDHSIYSEASTSLAYAFACCSDLKPSYSAWHILRIWPVNLSDGFLASLQQSHPGALVLLAHYCLLLWRLEKQWFFEGRAAKLLCTISQSLDSKWLNCIAYPMQQMGLGYESEGAVT